MRPGPEHPVWLAVPEEDRREAVKAAQRNAATRAMDGLSDIPLGDGKSLSDALELMARYQVRRVAVTAEDDRLIGVVSQADVAREGKDKDTGQLLEAISREPQGPRTN